MMRGAGGFNGFWGGVLAEFGGGEEGFEWGSNGAIAHVFAPPPKVVGIDGRGHLLGRLAAIVAKQVLLGKCGPPPL